MTAHFAPPYATKTAAAQSTPPPNAEFTIDDLHAALIEFFEMLQELLASLLAEIEEHKKSAQSDLQGIETMQIVGG